jgi:hypothetical protein
MLAITTNIRGRSSTCLRRTLARERRRAILQAMKVPAIAAIMFAIGCRPAAEPPPAKEAAKEVAKEAAKEPDEVRMDGHGRVRFGASLAEVRTATSDPLDVPAHGCHVVAPTSAGTPPRFTYLVHDGVVARIDVTSPEPLAAGGGRVGMLAADLRRAYPSAIEEPHKYDPKAATWIIGPTDAAHFVFELDGTGKVVTWRAGVLPQIDWVERCG